MIWGKSMKRRLRKIVTILVALLFVILVINKGIYYYVNAALEEEAVVAKLDFEKEIPVGIASSNITSLDDNKVYGTSVELDSTMEKQEALLLSWSGTYPEELEAQTTISCDLILPAESYDKWTEGEFTVEAAFLMGEDYTKVKSADVATVAPKDMKKDGEYYIKQVEVSFSSEIAMQKGIDNIQLQVMGTQNNYSGNVYIDNIVVNNGK